MKTQVGMENKMVVPSNENKADARVRVKMLKGNFAGRTLLLDRAAAETFVKRGVAEYVAADKSVASEEANNGSV